MKNLQTIEMLTEWILKHRNDSVFVGDTKEQIALGIQQDVKDNTILYVWDDNENDFIGVVSYRVDRNEKIVFVRNLLITKHSSLVVFIKFFEMSCPGYTIAANRKNKYINYNTFRMCHLLKKGEV